MELLGYLADEITQRGYGMFLQKILPPMEDWLTRLINSRRADAIVVIGQSTEHKVLEEAARHYRPLVVWGGQLLSQVAPQRHRGCDSVFYGRGSGGWALGDGRGQ